MVANLPGSVGTGTKENEPSTGRVWAAGFYHVTARSRFISLIFLIFFSGRLKPRVLNPRIRGSACVCIYMRCTGYGLKGGGLCD